MQGEGGGAYINLNNNIDMIGRADASAEDTRLLGAVGE